MFLPRVLIWYLISSTKCETKPLRAGSAKDQSQPEEYSTMMLTVCLQLRAFDFWWQLFTGAGFMYSSVSLPSHPDKQTAFQKLACKPDLRRLLAL